MRPARKVKRLAKTVLLVVFAAAVAAAAVVPALDRHTGRAGCGELTAAIEAHLADFPAPAPASYVGDQHYQWSVLACPTGQYRPPGDRGATEPVTARTVPD